MSSTSSSLTLLFALLLVAAQTVSSFDIGPNPAAPQTNKSECATEYDCLNGGVCNSKTQECECPTSYSGYACQMYCPMECQNGGFCVDSMTGVQDSRQAGEKFQCLCPNLFNGKYCEIPYMECPDGRQCLHGGQCQEEGSSGSFFCDCPKGRTGAFCQDEQSGSSGPPVILYLTIIPVVMVVILSVYLVYLVCQKYKTIPDVVTSPPGDKKAMTVKEESNSSGSSTSSGDSQDGSDDENNNQKSQQQPQSSRDENDLV